MFCMLEKTLTNKQHYSKGDCLNHETSHQSRINTRKHTIYSKPFESNSFRVSNWIYIHNNYY